ncbi:MAG: helicase subunit of dna repair complex [uncultured bacterium]|nr:MAG: helicase subunit of dna repair complex [uncultured bacterium]
MIIICSYNFARSKIADIQNVIWDLVVIDEAHRLRNVYKKNNKIAKAIFDGIANSPKIMLTATPLQNSLMELYGLVSFIDPHLFGSMESFRDQFASKGANLFDSDFNSLKRRLSTLCQRTLRRQVREYVPYTNRISLTQDFTPTDDEIKLYESVSAYLQRPDSFALPKNQRGLITLVLRKILASSSFAISDTLGGLISRLENKQKALLLTNENDCLENYVPDYESSKEDQDEWAESDSENDDNVTDEKTLPLDGEIQLRAIRAETQELLTYKALAQSIITNAKGEALLTALNKGFDKLKELHAPEKALIFTESRRTQRYLHDLLKDKGYDGQIILLNGTNSETSSQTIYKQWLLLHKGQDCITGRKSADIRSALIEEFKERALIMIATESGAEGLNFQFCSLVVNYDLPWNPQRIEQRIGRCHRYGQRFDVVVINFINRRNAADQRVFELLSEKLKIFDGIFGSSDEVLGLLESGVDFEKRIHVIYQTCRSSTEINNAFDSLKSELEDTINARMADTRSKLLEHFDEDVQRRLRICKQEAVEWRSLFEEWLWRLTQAELGDYAEFNSTDYAFNLKHLPDGIYAPGILQGTYRLITHPNGTEDHHYRLNHPLAETLISAAQNRELSPCEIIFDYSGHSSRISIVEKLRNKTGWLRLTKLSIAALEQEEKLIFSGISDDSVSLDNEICSKLFSIKGHIQNEISVPENISTILTFSAEKQKNNIIHGITERNRSYFESEMEKMETWADDLKEQLESQLKELDREIRTMKKEARKTSILDEKVSLHKKAKELERKRTEKRKNLFEAQDEIDKKKEIFLENIESRLNQNVNLTEVFTIRWGVI